MVVGEVYVGVRTLPQGLKPLGSFVGRAARLKPCPFKAGHFTCSFKAVHFSGVV
jgi:hypothetical protein